jgi:hypothetical protein
MKPTCFVLMPFAKEFEEVYEHGIAPAAEVAGFSCHRADHAVGPNAIISHIIKSIFAADVIVADVTGSNPNVFYELGVAHTIDNKTLVICERSDKQLPFNLAAYRVIYYNRSIEGIKEELRSKLVKHLTELHTWKNHPTNPVQDFRPIQYTVPLQGQAELEDRIKELKGEIRALGNEMQRGELRTLILSLSEIEFRHLRNLAAEGPFNYEKRHAFLVELRKLRTLKMIKNKPNTSIGGIPQTGDLKDYLELTALTREVIEEMFRWIGSDLTS